MANISWPGFRFETVSYSIEHNIQRSFMRNGRTLTEELPGTRFVCTVNFGDDLEEEGFTEGERPALEALIASLKGGANRLQMSALWRPIPRGTMRGTPVLSTGAAAGASSIAMSSVGGTLLAGDIIGVGGQIVEVLANATPSGGAMTVQFLPELRTAVSTSAPVSWNGATTLWIPMKPVSGPFPFALYGRRPGFSLELVETW